MSRSLEDGRLLHPEPLVQISLPAHFHPDCPVRDIVGILDGVAHGGHSIPAGLFDSIGSLTHDDFRLVVSKVLETSEALAGSDAASLINGIRLLDKLPRIMRLAPDSAEGTWALQGVKDQLFFFTTEIRERGASQDLYARLASTVVNIRDELKKLPKAEDIFHNGPLDCELVES